MFFLSIVYVGVAVVEGAKFDVNDVTMLFKLLHDDVLTGHHVVNFPNKKFTFFTRYTVENSSVWIPTLYIDFVVAL